MGGLITYTSFSLQSSLNCNYLSEKYGVCVGIETMGGVETKRKMLLISRLALPRVGINLDIGHMYFENCAAFEDYGTLGDLIDEINILLNPIVIGGFNTPILFASPEVNPPEILPTKLKLISLNKNKDESIWLRYEVIHNFKDN